MTEEAPESLSNMKTSADAEGSDAASENAENAAIAEPEPDPETFPREYVEKAP